MAGVESKELAGISGSLGHPMTQTSGSITPDAVPMVSPVLTGSGFTVASVPTGDDGPPGNLPVEGIRITLDRGAALETIVVLARHSNTTVAARYGTTIRVTQNNLAVDGTIDLALGNDTIPGDIDLVDTDRVDFTIMVSNATN